MMLPFVEFRQYIKKQEYDVYKYFFPTWMEKRICFLSDFFNLMDRDVPFQFKRRKNPCEYVESAVMMLARLEQILYLEIPVVIGTKYLNPMPWVVLANKEIETCHKFADFGDLLELYFPRIQETDSFRGYYVNFRIYSNLPYEIAERNKINPHAVVSTAVCLACDIIRFCGPDCDILFDFFSNDIRDTLPDIKKWATVRIEMFGESGKIKENPYDFKLGQLTDPPIPLTSNVFFDEVSEGDINENEVTKSFNEATLLDVDISKFVLFDDYD